MKLKKLKLFSDDLSTDYIYGSTKNYNICFLIYISGDRLIFHAHIDPLFSSFDRGEYFELDEPAGTNLIMGIELGVKRFMKDIEYRYYSTKENPSKVIREDVKAWLEVFEEKDEFFGLNRFSG